MDFFEAKQIVLFDALEDEGAFTRLRLGENPGIEHMSKLRRALRLLWTEVARTGTIPQDIAFACGVIIRFQDECLSNLRTSVAIPPEIRDSIRLGVHDITQGAFDVLAGANAQTWVVARPDLEDVR